MGAFLAFLPTLLQLAAAAPELENDIVDIIDKASSVFNHPAAAGLSPQQPEQQTTQC